MHLLLIYNGYSNVPIVHQMLSFTTVTYKAMCYWSVVSARFKAQICFLLPLTLHDSVHSEIIANTYIQWVEKDVPERCASDFSGLLGYKCNFRSSVDGCWRHTQKMIKYFKIRGFISLELKNFCRIAWAYVREQWGGSNKMKADGSKGIPTSSE